MSMWFAIGVLAVTAAIVFALVMRRHGSPARGSDAARLEIYRDRRRELDDELATGALDTDRHVEAVAELERTAASELGREVDARGGPARSRLHWIAAAAAPLFAIGMYLWTGDGVPGAGEGATQADLPQLVEQLAERMESRPDDLQGWMLLGRTRVVMGEYGGAIAAWREALRLAPEDAGVMANLAEALVLDDSSQLEHEAAILLDRSLELDPGNPKALWYGGLLAQARGDIGSARGAWQRLLAMDPPDEFRGILERRLASLSEAPGFELSVTISITSDLAAAIVEGSALFVTLHAPDTNGPPLAAVRVPATNFPVSVRMTDSEAMLAGSDLSAYERLRVVARVSAGGEAQRRAGEPIGTAQWHREEGARVEVRIDELVGGNRDVER